MSDPYYKMKENTQVSFIATSTIIQQIISSERIEILLLLR